MDPTPKSRKRLKTLDDCRRFLAGVVLALDADKIDGSKAGKLGYLVGILGKLIEGGDLERRVSELETAITRKNSNRRINDGNQPAS